MRIVSTAFIFAGLNIALQGVFQALECGIFMYRKVFKNKIDVLQET